MSRRRILGVIIGLLVSAFLIWAGGTLAAGLAKSRLEALSAERVKLYHSTLEEAIGGLRHLPLVLAQHHTIIRLLETGSGLQDVRDYLSSTTVASDAAVIYVLDTNGTTVASSNWKKSESFEGRNYGFRPYHRDALEGREGQFFAVGVTTSRAGYFISRPVFSPGKVSRVLGVVVVKVELNDLQAAWREGGERVMVSDANGIIVSTSNPEWLYRSLGPLSTGVRNKITANRTFTGQSLDLLNFQALEGGRLGDERGIIELDGVRYLDMRAVMATPRWTVHYLADMGSVLTVRWVAMGFVAGGLLFLSVMALYYRENQRKKSLFKEAAEAQRIREANLKLAEEIEVRKQAEAKLNAAQQELVRASKMAALGRMSAAIAHEVNQPISAIRTFTASTKLLLERGETDQAGDTLDDITDVTEHLSKITGDLKLFARTTREEPTLVDLEIAIRKVLKLFDSDFQTGDVELTLDFSATRPCISGSAHRIEQVVSNLVKNALDAMAHQTTERSLLISLENDGAEVVLRIADTGCGMDEETLNQVFDPFFTTKPVKQGVGLGLAISYGLVEDMGGILRARNRQPQGAVFSMRFVAAENVSEDLKAAE